jgi:transcriptional regulator with XRE-family HTH domain
VLIGELIRATRERHGLTQARLARRISGNRAYVSRVESGKASPAVDWAARALAAMGESWCSTSNAAASMITTRAHRMVGGWDGDRRLADFLASTTALDALTRTEP